MVVGKLSYTNRKIEGQRLACMVKKDLLKRINPKSSYTKDAHIDLSLSGKRIGTHLDVICDGLLESFRAGTLKLGELHLDDNDLTIESLGRLNFVVIAARHDLKIVNLKHNNLKVQSEEEVSIWLEFVRALSNCLELETLDLSENPLGDKAIECLYMLYCREGTYREYLPAATSSSVLLAGTSMLTNLSASEVDIIYNPEDGYTDSQIVPVSSAKSSNHSSPRISRSNTFNITTESSPPLPRSRGGLRGILCLQLENTRMTDAAALSMSYVVEHCYSGHLSSTNASLDEKPEHPPQPCNGVVYSKNEFSVPGERLLEIARSSKEILNGFGAILPERALIRRRSSTTVAPLSRDRRRSSVSNNTHARLAMTPVRTTDLERARTKIQGMLIKDDRDLLLELWRVTLTVLKAVHALCFTTPSGTSSCLPVELWHKIVIEALDVHRVLSGHQRSAILRWIKDNECRDIERDFDHRINHVKTWRILQAMQCLEYDWVE